jgi:putative transposase
MMILTYRYRIKDNSAKKRLRQHAIALNQAWNFCVQTQRECEAKYRAGAPKRRWPTHFDLQKLTAGSSKELGTHAGAITEICRVFSEARDKRKRAPRFRTSFGPKRNLGWVPFRSCDRQLDGNVIRFLGKTYRWFGSRQRPLPEIVKGGSFVEDTQGKWWICFHVEVAEDRLTGNGEVGIDLGLKTLATLSDGEKVENLRHRRTWAQRLAKAQRARNKRRVKAIHARIANVRKDHLHKATCRIARENGLIAVGNVNSSRLAKTRMAKSVLDAGWASFKSMLGYKARRHSASFLEIDEKFTTQTCSGCGSIAGPKGYAGLNERSWVCDRCGACHDRDVNSAINILRLGLSAQAHVDESRRAA